MAFFYTGVGDHHILQSPTPAWLKTIAEVSSWMLLVPVFAFTINILGTMKGNWDKFFTNLPLRFTLTAFFFYFLVNIQGAFEALQPFNKLTHFTNFVVAHAHLALLGAFTILGMGVIDYMVAQIYARPLWSRSLTEWQYWLVTVGFTGFFSVLTLAGFQQGFSWEQGIPEVNVLPQLHAYYIARGIFGAMIVLSGIVQIVNIGMTIFTDTHERRRRETLRVAEAIAPPVDGLSMADEPDPSEADERIPRGWARHPPERMLITPLVAGLGGLLAFFTVVSIVVWLPIHTFDPPPPPTGRRSRTRRVTGRNLFAQNGCYVCHSGYSRPQDVRDALYFLYPKVSQPGDFYGSDQSPNLLGTERTGPDLSQEAGWHPDDWQRAHFYDPRYVDPLSLMPPMKSLFSDKQVEQLIAFVADAQRQVRPAALRRPALREARRAREPGLPAAVHGLPGRAQADRRGQRTSSRPTDQLEEAPNLVADRPQLLALRRPAAGHRAEPDARQGGLPRALRRLPRPRRATARARARTSCRRRPPTSPTRTTPAAAATPGPGDFYYRILRGWPGTGDGELRRPPLGRRHLAGRAVRQDDPERHARPEPRARAEGLHHLAAVEGAARLAEDAAEARRTTPRSTRQR